MPTEVTSAFIQLGSVGLMLWWLTQTLIPQLQKELTSAIAAFQHEMQEERVLHREMNQRLMEKHDKAVEGLLEHLRQHV